MNIPLKDIQIGWMASRSVKNKSKIVDLWAKNSTRIKFLYGYIIDEPIWNISVNSGPTSPEILGRVLFKLIEWFQDKKNQKKVAAIGKFLKKTWPVLLSAFLLFGTSFGRMAVKLGVMITKFSIRLVTKIIPALFLISFCMAENS